MQKATQVYVSPFNIEKDVIKTSHVLYKQDKAIEILDKDITQIVMSSKRKNKFEYEEIRNKIKEYIKSLKEIIEKLEQEKRKSENIEYQKLLKIYSLIEIELKNKKIVSKKIKEVQKNALHYIKKDVNEFLKASRRLYHNSEPRGYYIPKLRKESLLDRINKISAKKLRKNEAKETSLESNIKQAIQAMPENPSEKLLQELKRKIIGFFREYVKSFNYLLKIEINIEIEEARKLHKIDQYINLLKKIDERKFKPEIQELIMIKLQANEWVKQDYGEASRLKTLVDNVSDFEKKIENITEFKDDFSAIVTKDLQIGESHGVIYLNQKKKNGKGLILFHGFLGNVFGLDLFAKRCANQGYCVLSLNLPQHHIDQNKFRLGIASEYVLTAANYLRKYLKVSKVGVVAHSAGAVSSMFAACNYNQQLEHNIYWIVEKILELIGKNESVFEDYYKNFKSESAKDNELPNEVLKKVFEEFDRYYTRLKKEILDSIKVGTLNSSRIDSFVLLSPPMDLSEAIPFTGFLSMLKPKTVKAIFGLMQGAFVKEMKELNNPLQWQGNKEKYIVWKNFYLKFEQMKDFLNYINKVKNPQDYMNLINYFADLPNEKENARFIEYFRRNYIYDVPKLFLYGNLDIMVRPFFQRKKIESVYSMFGNYQIIRVKGMAHFLNKDRFQMDSSYGLQSSRIAHTIFNFLDQTL